jgi:hypothetical protein
MSTNYRLILPIVILVGFQITILCMSIRPEQRSCRKTSQILVLGVELGDFKELLRTILKKARLCQTFLSRWLPEKRRRKAKKQCSK